MKLTILGLAAVAFAVVALSSPYWLFRELTRPNDEALPPWMGDARARKRRLLVILAVFALAVGAFLIGAGRGEP